MLDALMTVLSRDSAVAYIRHHQRLGKPIDIENVKAHCRQLQAHRCPNAVADRMVAGLWANLPPPEKLDARRGGRGHDSPAGTPRKSTDRSSLHHKGSSKAPTSSHGPRRARKPRNALGLVKLGKTGRGKDPGLAQRLAVRDVNRENSSLPPNLVAAVPDIPIARYRAIPVAKASRNDEDDLYNRNYRSRM